MPTLTDSILDLRRDAPEHDYLLVADDTKDLSGVVSDGVHAAQHMSADVLLFYRGETMLLTPASTFSAVVSELHGKLEGAPDKDPVASDFPAEP